MKRLLVSLSFSLLCVTTHAQNNLRHVTFPDITTDSIPASPRQRVSRSVVLALTDQWQAIGFISANSARDVNTFSSARFDFVNSKILFNNSVSMEQAYDLSFDYELTNNKGQSKIELRFVVLAPTPVYFPFPDATAGNNYVDISEINMPGSFRRHFEYTIHTTPDIKSYGVQIQMRAVSYVASTNILTGVITSLLTALTGTDRVNLNTANLNIYAK